MPRRSAACSTTSLECREVRSARHAHHRPPPPARRPMILFVHNQGATIRSPTRRSSSSPSAAPRARRRAGRKAGASVSRWCAGSSRPSKGECRSRATRTRARRSPWTFRSTRAPKASLHASRLAASPLRASRLAPRASNPRWLEDSTGGDRSGHHRNNHAHSVRRCDGLATSIRALGGHPPSSRRRERAWKRPIAIGKGIETMVGTSIAAALHGRKAALRVEARRLPPQPLTHAASWMRSFASAFEHEVVLSDGHAYWRSNVRWHCAAQGVTHVQELRCATSLAQMSPPPTAAIAPITQPTPTVSAPDTRQATPTRPPAPMTQSRTVSGRRAASRTPCPPRPCRSAAPGCRRAAPCRARAALARCSSRASRPARCWRRRPASGSPPRARTPAARRGGHGTCPGGARCVGRRARGTPAPPVPGPGCGSHGRRPGGVARLVHDELRADRVSVVVSGKLALPAAASCEGADSQ